MFKLIKLEVIGLGICIISLLIAYTYFDLVKELAACTLCVLDRFLFFGISCLWNNNLLEMKLVTHPKINKMFQ